jgi:GTP-dependent phosphoenolpyruvate carboxykinase
MPRGRVAPPGTETWNALGYCQVKTTDRGWVGKHILILEETLGRQLVFGERAIFKDGDKRNLDPNNIELAASDKKKSLQARIAKLKSEIEDRQALLKDLEDELAQEK